MAKNETYSPARTTVVKHTFIQAEGPSNIIKFSPKTETAIKQPEERVTVRFDFSGDAYQILADLAKQKGETIPGTICDAIAHEKWMHDLYERGGRILVERKGRIFTNRRPLIYE